GPRNRAAGELEGARPASSQIHRRRKSLENLWFSSDLLFAQQTYRRLRSLSKMSVKDFFDKLGRLLFQHDRKRRRFL
ncbi:MAG: hypothetical protein IJ112_02205, partial [Oscillospiraceae bacterium]|nr:hypothetical protein [Oscillospiraceae bacterium]